MRHELRSNAARRTMSRLWRFVLIALGTLILCSCESARSPMDLSATDPQRARRQAYPPHQPYPAPQAFVGGDSRQSLDAFGAGAVPPQPLGNLASIGYAEQGWPPMVDPSGQVMFDPSGQVIACAAETPYGPPVAAGVPTGPWSPPGLAGPWPRDEYLADGGDRGVKAMVRPDWEIRGLNTQDTIAHYDTIDGRTIVQPSNRVYIYSPRFGAVRQVVSLRQNDQADGWAHVRQRDAMILSDETQVIASSKQHLQPSRHVSRDLAGVYRGRQSDGAVSAEVGLNSFQQGVFQPFEAMCAIRLGKIESSEMAWLSRGVQAAVTWTNNEAVQVIIDRQRAAAEISDRRLATVYRIEEPPSLPKLRIIKVASTQAAQPGETVDFTIRFDNIGNQPIGNVTIIDNLTTRLEFVPESDQCSIEDHQFLTQPNEGDSLSLRWEINAPMMSGEGGIIRFQCRVR